MRRSASEWQTLIQAQVQSGLSVAAFCREQAISLSSFYAQRHRVGHLSGGESVFVKVAMPCSSSAPLTLQGSFGILHLPEGIDSQWLAQLLRGLS
jgi:putative transposase